MLMGKDTPPDDRKVRIGTDKIVRELRHKIEQLAECAPVNNHRDMPAVEHDTVFIVIDIGGILQAPGLSIDRDRDHAVVFPCRMVHPAGVSHIFIAQLALRIRSLPRKLSRGDRPRILLRLAQVDSDVQISVLRRSQPAHILRDPVAADIIGILAELIVPFRSSTGAALFQSLPEHRCDIRRSGRKGTHQLRVKQIPVRNAFGRDHSLVSRVAA